MSPSLPATSPTWRVRAELWQHKMQEGEALNGPHCLHIHEGLRPPGFKHTAPEPRERISPDLCAKATARSGLFLPRRLQTPPLIVTLSQAVW